MSETCREIVFDTETTGLRASDGDRIIEIGAIELVDRFPTGRTYHSYLNPQGREVHPDALSVHGISNEFLSDKPEFSDIIDEFEEFIAEADLVAHNASFDMEFFNAELIRVGRSAIEPARVIDTLQIARRKHPMGPNSLDALCSRYGIDNSKREKHGALLDSELLAEVYIELLGGRQASFSLDNPEPDDTGSEIRSASEAETLRKRPVELPARLTEKDREKHRIFIGSLGENAIWNKITRSGNPDQ